MIKNAFQMPSKSNVPVEVCCIGVTSNYGFGWQLQVRSRGNVEALYHTGSANEGFKSIMWRHLQEWSAVIILTNSFDARGLKKLLRDIHEVYFPHQHRLEFEREENDDDH